MRIGRYDGATGPPLREAVVKNRRSALGVLFRNELRMLLRDTRTMLIAVLAPLILFPVMAFILNAVEKRDVERIERATLSWTLTGDAQAWGRPLIDRALQNRGADSASVGFVEQLEANPDSALEAGGLNLIVRALTPAGHAEWAERRQADRADADMDTLVVATNATSTADGTVGGPEDSTPSLQSVPTFVLEFRARSDLSRRASEAFSSILLGVREELRDSVFLAAGFPVDRSRVAVTRAENVASPAQEAGAFLGLALTPFLILLMLGGGSIVAADAISGEKERGTLETLLTSAAQRNEIVRAKLLAVVVVGMAVVVINVANLLVYSTLGVLDLPSQLAVSLSALDLVLLLILIVPLTVLVGSALLLLSGISNSYKEYQTYFFPVFLVFLIPSLAALIPGMELRSAIALVPIAGVGVAVRDLLLGEVDLLFFGIALLSTAGTAAWLTAVTERTLSNEKLISNARLDQADLTGGPALFPRHVLAWFLGFWVVFFVTAVWFGEALGVRGQVISNLVVIFFGGSMLVARRYRLPLKSTFMLRRPHPLVMAVVLIAAPSALVVGAGISEFVNTWLFPLPQGMLEAMGDQLGLDMPLAQLLFFVAVMPAVFEELAFRGLLVTGLMGTRLPKWGIVVAGGLIFGFFHVALFRIFPTAWLGMNLVMVILLTRSIWPAMLWHFLNNALALVPTQLGWVDADFEIPEWALLPAIAGLALTWWVMWKWGRPPREPGPG